MTKQQRIRQRRRRIAIVAAGAVLLGLILILLAVWLGTTLLKPASGTESGVSSAVSTSSGAPTSSAGSSSSPQNSSEVSQGETSSSSTSSAPNVPGNAATYIQPAGFEWNLVLANDYNKAPDWCFNETYLVKHGTGHFDERAVGALSDMIAAAKRAGITDMRDVSTYRKYEVQERNYNAQVTKFKNQGHSQEEAERLANTVVKRPGYSEHHTGLAADMGGSGDFSIEMSFESTPAFDWLIEHCAEYGFILRFPKDKEDITGVIYEPWHYRYVGVEHATYIMEHGLCLEEYLAMKGI